MDKFSLLFICGIYNVLLAVFHICFWKIFKWKSILNTGSKATKYIMQIMNIQLIYLFLAMSYLYLFNAKELIQSKIGTLILVIYAGFWIVRFLLQFIFLKQKGKFVIGLTMLFLIGAIIHTLPILL